MWPFSRKRASTALTVQQAMAARPVRAVEPDIEPAADGGARLKVRIRPTRFNRWIFRVPEGATKTFELDAVGLFVWNLCDGRTTVQQIVRRLAKQYSLNLREAEVSTRLFLQTLIKKGLLAVPIEEQ